MENVTMMDAVFYLTTATAIMFWNDPTGVWLFLLRALPHLGMSFIY